MPRTSFGATNSYSTFLAVANLPDPLENNLVVYAEAILDQVNVVQLVQNDDLTLTDHSTLSVLFPDTILHVVLSYILNVLLSCIILATLSRIFLDDENVFLGENLEGRRCGITMASFTTRLSKMVPV